MQIVKSYFYLPLVMVMDDLTLLGCWCTFLSRAIVWTDHPSSFRMLIVRLIVRLGV